MKQKLDPEIQKAFTDLFKGLSEKSNVDDYPCKDVPCEYWWVRYAVACTYLKNSHDKIWEPKIEEIKSKYGVISIGFQGHFNFFDCGKNKKLSKSYFNRKIIIGWKNQYGDYCERALIDNGADEPLFSELDGYIKETKKIQWTNCPYEQEKQSVCPFYEPSEFYKKREELLTSLGGKP